jgi:hypothetical protein
LGQTIIRRPFAQEKSMRGWAFFILGASMAYKDEKLEAHRLFIEEHKSLEEIAKSIPDVSIKTLYRWASEGNWQGEKEAISLTSFSAVKSMLQAAVARMTVMVGEIQRDGKINSGEVYALRQLILSAKSLQKEVDSFGNLLLAIEEFTSFLAEQDPEMLEKIHPLLVRFGVEMSKKYGKKR